jgi:ABC-2 type transport system ATP-binding protein
VTLAVPQGATFGFLGPNGAGKTTTLRLLLDLLRPSSGAAWIGGFHCREEGLKARALVGYLPGELPVYPDLTGSGFLKFLTAAGRRDVSAPYLERLLRRFDVSALDLARRMRDYSQGMKRKLGLIQALMAEPPVVILDEPTAGLDPLMIDAFAETLAELKRCGTTVFLSSHVLSEVEKTCDAIGLVRRGRLVTVRKVDDIRRELPKRVTIEFAAATNGHVPGAPGVKLVTRRPHACVLDVHGPLGPLMESLREFPVADMRIDEPSLEQYVLDFYVGEERPS